VAAARLKRLFPERRVVGVPAREVLLGGGNITASHKQVPRAGGARRNRETRCRLLKLFNVGDRSRRFLPTLLSGCGAQ